MSGAAPGDDILNLLKRAFRPHAPINSPESFVGRAAELVRVKESLSQPGLQIVIFGERGAGKTSLANIATTSIIRIQVFCEEASDFSKILRDIVLEYQKIDPARIVYDAVSDSIRAEGTMIPMSKLDGNTIRRILPRDSDLCIVLDELDRVTDPDVIPSLAEFAKNISTYQTNIKLVFIGVADSLKSLLRGHQSNFRNIREISLGAMTGENVKEIISLGSTVLNIQFSSDVVNEITTLSDRYPYYVHLISTEAARSCLSEGVTKVQTKHLNEGVIRAAEDTHASLREAYDRASSSIRGSKIYRRALWGLAKLPNTSHTTSDITQEVNQLYMSNNESSVTVQAVGQALKKLSGDERGNIVHSPLYGFHKLTHPLMKGYVRLKMRETAQNNGA